jgi:putative aldouronate transport system permease protein
MRGKISISSLIINSLFVFMSIIMLYPFWYTLVGSMLEYSEYFDKALFLWPDKPTFEAYRIIFSTNLIQDPMVVTILITVVGTVYSLLISSFVAYGLSKKFPGSSLLMYFIVFTMFFSGGLIPTYILYRQMHLINNILVYILPASINTFNLIVLRAYFSGLPAELEEAAKIDGYNEFSIFFKIVLQLSKPILATIGLFYAVHYWNTFFPSLFYVTSPKLRTLQDYLYRIIRAGDAEDLGLYTSKIVSLQTVKMANIILVISPIVIIYPFVQKYLVQGATIGAVKG